MLFKRAALPLSVSKRMTRKISDDTRPRQTLIEHDPWCCSSCPNPPAHHHRQSCPPRRSSHQKVRLFREGRHEENSGLRQGAQETRRLGPTADEGKRAAPAASQSPAGCETRRHGFLPLRAAFAEPAAAARRRGVAEGGGEVSVTQWTRSLRGCLRWTFVPMTLPISLACR